MATGNGKSHQQAIFSASDKTGLVEFARALNERGYKIYASDDTKAFLTEHHLSVQSLTEMTAPTPQLAVINLYSTTTKPALGNDDAALLRTYAKDFHNTIVVVDPADYPLILTELDRPVFEMRQKLAAKAFQHLACNDTAIAQNLRGSTEHFPSELTIGLTKRQELRYGENPHQFGAFYACPEQSFASIATAQQLQGKELSYNNILDADAALAVVRDFVAPTVTIIKHTNPCGLASHMDLSIAYERALAGDPISSYGGIVATNRTIDASIAQQMIATFFEVVVAPDYTPAALDLLKKKKSLRVLAVGDLNRNADQIAMGLEYQAVVGGFLAQTRDADTALDLKMQVMTSREPTLEEVTNLQFAWRAVKHVKSNGIVLAKNHAIVGIGGGQPSRVDAVNLALLKAGVRARGAVLASDAYFPKTDGIENAAQAGIRAIIQPGGSISDTDILEVAQQYQLAMIFTGRRHFKH